MSGNGRCLMGGCAEPKPGECKSCGFDRTEAKRRKGLKLKPGKNGLRRKVVGHSGKTE